MLSVSRPSCPKPWSILDPPEVRRQRWPATPVGVFEVLSPDPTERNKVTKDSRYVRSEAIVLNSQWEDVHLLLQGNTRTAC